MMPSTPIPDKNWSLFLDRDGVINQKLEDDYVKSWSEFVFLDGVLSSLATLSQIFGHIFIVTNQRGIGRGLMTEEDLQQIHRNMLQKIREAGGRIDRIYYCPFNPEDDKHGWRKPEIGMALQAKTDFPGVDFQRSVMLGDAWSDMEFGKKAGMQTVWISPLPLPSERQHLADRQEASLRAYCASLS